MILLLIQIDPLPILLDFDPCYRMYLPDCCPLATDHIGVLKVEHQPSGDAYRRLRVYKRTYH